jgi:hypothetical protein
MKEATRDLRMSGKTPPMTDYFVWLQEMEKQLGEYAAYELEAEVAWRKVELSRQRMITADPGSPAQESWLIEIEDQKRRYSTAVRNAQGALGRFKDLSRKIQQIEF